MSLVSVVIPTYNCAEYIGTCLESVLCQTHSELEIIIVDDGSTDDTEAIVSSYCDRRIIYTRQENSGGPSRPRNVGVARAKGDFIFAFDSDDVLDREFIGRCHQLLSTYPDLGLVFGNFSRIDEAGTLMEQSCLDQYSVFQTSERTQVSELACIMESSVAYSTLLHGDCIGRGVLYTRATFDEIGGYDETLTNGQDVDFYFRICSGYRIGYINTIGHFFRTHSKSISHRPGVGLASNRVLVLERQLARELEPNDRRVAIRRLAHSQYDLGEAYKASQRRDLARGYFKTSLKNNWQRVTLKSLVTTYLSERMELRIKAVRRRAGFGTAS